MKFQNCNLLFVRHTQTDEFLTNRFLLDIFYVRKVANKAKRTQQVPEPHLDFISSLYMQIGFIP